MARPLFIAASLSISSIDSFLASSIKPHVLMRRISASSGVLRYRNPLLISFRVRLSESTVFFGQPRLMTDILFAKGMSLFHCVVDDEISDNRRDKANKQRA